MRWQIIDYDLILDYTIFLDRKLAIHDISGGATLVIPVPVDTLSQVR